MIAAFLHGLADFIDAIERAWAEQRVGFSDREAGDFLDLTDIKGIWWPVAEIDARTNGQHDSHACPEAGAFKLDHCGSPQQSSDS